MGRKTDRHHDDALREQERQLRESLPLHVRLWDRIKFIVTSLAILAALLVFGWMIITGTWI